MFTLLMVYWVSTCFLASTMLLIMRCSTNWRVVSGGKRKGESERKKIEKRRHSILNVNTWGLVNFNFGGA